MISVVFDGSRFPVGSSHSRIFGLPTSARAIAVRCCSPPDSSLGNIRLLCESPTRSSARGTMRITSLVRVPVTWSANATFSQTVLCESSLKSWKTTPMLRRSFGTRPRRSVSTRMLST